MQEIRMTLYALLACCTLAIPLAHAAGEMGDAKHADEGIRFFGFVRDGNGKPIVEAKVSAEIRNGVKYVTHTGKNGMYSFNGFNKSVKPDDVTISCEKDKLQQAKTVDRKSTRLNSSH